MSRLEYKSYIKLIVIRIDDFYSEIIDERNFDLDDEFGLLKFKQKYIGIDNCTIVSVEM